MSAAFFVYNSQSKAINAQNKDKNAIKICRTKGKDVARTYKILYYVK
jgi:hypothetical protein